MGTASIMLQDGTPVTVTFDDNGDGKLDAAEITRAQNRLIEKLGDKFKLTGEVEIGSQIRIIESGQASKVLPTSVGAGALVNNNVVRLFGSPKSFFKKAPQGSEDWVATATHGKEIYYREMGRWDETQGKEIEGRGLHVDPDSGKILEVEVTVVEDGYERRVWKPLDKLSADEKEGLPLGVLPTEAIGWTRPAVSPVSWKFVGTQDDFHYFQGPGDRLARRSVTNPENVQIAEIVDGQPAFRAAEEVEQVPIVVTIGDGPGARTFSAVQTDVVTEKVQTADGREEEKYYRVYSGTEFPSNSAVVLRRPIVESKGPWEIQTRNGFETLKPAPRELVAPMAGPGANRNHHARRVGATKKKSQEPARPNVVF